MLAAALLAVTACQLTHENELNNVARDWAHTIRSSQVIPVYPLTEDLQPGDVFLVARSASSEQEQYRSKGFLPLDQLVTRLHGLDYDRFYRGGYLAGDRDRDGDKTAAAAPTATATPTTAGRRAVFPPYSFSIERGESPRIAVPTKGLPFALAFLQADKAAGSVLIRDAHTYGIGTDDVTRALRAWSARDGVQGDLAQMSQAHALPTYLRIVQRVYLAQGADVMLQRTDVGGWADASARANAASLPHNETLDRLNESLKSVLPDGNVRVVHATTGSITLHEVFDRPLVIGYLAVDVPIEADGRLGAPVATLDRLEGRVGEALRPSLRTPVVASEASSVNNWQRELRRRQREVEAIGDPVRRTRVIARTAERLPAASFGEFRERALRTTDDGLVRDFFDRLESWVQPPATDGGASCRQVLDHLDAALAEREQ